MASSFSTVDKVESGNAVIPGSFYNALGKVNQVFSRLIRCQMRNK